MSKLFTYRHYLIVGLLFIISACSTGYAPVSDISSRASKDNRVVKSSLKRRNTSPKLKVPSNYRVKSGDTLYSIAWRYGLDFKTIAKENGISQNYLIYKGQILRFGAKGKSKSSSLKEPKVNSEKLKTLKGNETSKVKKSNASQSSTNSAKTAAKKSVKQSKNTHKYTKSKIDSNVRWVWPTSNTKYNKFNNENKGIEIFGRVGDRVLAAASGKVVYAGNGIIGYGNLIIVKHSDQYLSAYAHNSVILVKENKQVKAGEKIAEIGNSGTIKTILHFEIRKDGKPVNPIKYLPKK